jgi:hypothetical protein
MSSRSLRHAAAVVLALAAGLAGAASARADASWHDGQAVDSQLYNPCLGITEFGALAQAGYDTDPAATRAGDVFYGHAVFGAATHVGGNCTDTDQAAELDLVLPPGVSLAIDAAHPISCFYADDGGASGTNPTCPTHAVTGTYGPMLPAGDGGAGWDMPPGRTLEVQFPLVSHRELKGPAGGHCPETLDEIGTSPQRDCLLLAVHVADGTDDPWLLPNVQMVLAPSAGLTPQPTPAPTPTPGPTPPAVATARLTAPKAVKLAALRAHGLTATITVPASGATAALSVKQGSHVLGRATKHNLEAGTAKVRIGLSKSARRHARPGRLTLTARIGATTLKTSVTVKR